MADDRPLEDTTDAIARLNRDFEDFKSTMLVRVPTRPTGTIEPTFLSTAPPGTLICNGQVVSRTTYAALWQWAQDNSAVAAGRFTVGDGSTTFGLPNMSGRVMVGAGTLGSDTYAIGATGGAATRSLTASELPSHTHTGSTAGYTHSHGSAGSHSHSGSTSGGGSHGGHNSGSFGVAAGSGGAVSNNGNTSGGDHSHSMSLNNSGDHSHSSDTHSHSITLNNTGSGSAFDQRQPYLAINIAVWT